MVEVLQLGYGWGKVGNTVVDPPELGVFGVHGIPVRLLNINLYTCTEFWRKCCKGSQPYRMAFWLILYGGRIFGKFVVVVWLLVVVMLPVPLG